MEAGAHGGDILRGFYLGIPLALLGILLLIAGMVISIILDDEKIVKLFEDK